MHAVHLALLVGQLLGCSPVLLGLGVQAVDGLVEEETSVTCGLRSCQLLRPISLYPASRVNI